ncbi:type 4a pilus biogenesis protein PilO [Candidatus Igneacidithiobacillus taiwanensis]|uniref:type 4a pilus biogenesis protein PilO n=1 Tax=Candidatus Igneacidithiobacillus taiwanensis TaxID=1945924 RepID=UPI0028A0F5DC|nr:type 4a pilus biogenesis protein PilO [Candidatus Igneacidithiobacillus taiwanensis]MCE5359476.1 type 4a pilus biogenesis protein PilO [Acidithiobacillus sp.]
MTWDEINNLQLEDILQWPVKTKLIAAVILVILIGAGVWFFFISPENEKYEALHSQVADLKEQVRNKQLLAANLPAYQAQIQEMNHRFLSFLQQLPDRSQIPSLLDNVTLAGRSRGLDFNLFQPLPEVDKNFYAEIPVKISVTGTYDDLGRFAAAVAAMPRIVTLGDITLKPIAEAPNTSIGQALKPQRLQMSCVVTTYRYLADSKTGNAK